MLARNDSGKYRYSVIHYVDEHLERLVAEQQNDSYDRIDLEHSINRLTPREFREDEIDEPSEDASEVEREIYRLRLAIRDDQRRIWELEAASTDNSEKIANYQARLEQLMRKMSKISVEIEARRANPQYEWIIHDHIKSNGDYYSSKGSDIQKANNYGLHEMAVDAKLFAKEPNRFLLWAGNLLPWKTEAKVQCVLRRRASFTLLALSPWLLIKTILRVIVTAIFAVIYLLLNIYGLRGIRYHYLKHPFDIQSLRDFADPEDTRPRWWTIQTNEVDWLGKKKYAMRNPFFYFVNPLMIAVTVVAGALFQAATSELIWLAIPFIVFLVLGLIVGLFGKKVRAFFSKLGDWMDERSKTKRKKAIAQTQREIREISCDSVLNWPTSGARNKLPRKNRTSYIIANTKAKVCKPFPGR